MNSGPRPTRDCSTWTANTLTSSEEDILQKPDRTTVVKTLQIEDVDMDTLSERQLQ